MRYLSILVTLLFDHLISQTESFCPVENTLYYRVKGSYRISQEYKAITKHKDFYVHEGIWFTHDVISLSFLQFIPKHSNYKSEQLKISLRPGHEKVALECRPSPQKLSSKHRVGMDGNADSNLPIPSPLCVSYEMKFDSVKTARKLLGLELNCNDNFKGKIILHHARFVVPFVDGVNKEVVRGYESQEKDGPKYALSLLELVVEGKRFNDGPLVAQLNTTKMLNPQYNPSSPPLVAPRKVNEPSKIFTTDGSLLYPVFPNVLELTQNLSRDVLFVDPEANTQLSSGYWPQDEYLRLSFHQVHAPGFHVTRGISISLQELSPWTCKSSTCSSKTRELVTILDSHAFHCNHKHHGKHKSTHNHIYSDYFINKKQTCDTPQLCRDFSTKEFEIKVLVLYHTKSVGRDFIGSPSLDKLGGTLYSYMIWVRPKPNFHLPDGQYVFQIQNNEVWPSKPKNIVNTWASRKIVTHAVSVILPKEKYLVNMEQEEDIFPHVKDIGGISFYDVDISEKNSETVTNRGSRASRSAASKPISVYYSTTSRRSSRADMGSNFRSVTKPHLEGASMALRENRNQNGEGGVVRSPSLGRASFGGGRGTGRGSPSKLETIPSLTRETGHQLVKRGLLGSLNPFGKRSEPPAVRDGQYYRVSTSSEEAATDPLPEREDPVVSGQEEEMLFAMDDIHQEDLDHEKDPHQTNKEVVRIHEVEDEPRPADEAESRPEDDPLVQSSSSEDEEQGGASDEVEQTERDDETQRNESEQEKRSGTQSKQEQPEEQPEQKKPAPITRKSVSIRAIRTSVNDLRPRNIASYLHLIPLLYYSSPNPQQISMLITHRGLDDTDDDLSSTTGSSDGVYDPVSSHMIAPVESEQQQEEEEEAETEDEEWNDDIFD